MMDTAAIRADFPILAQTDTPPVYFDNACMTLRPQVVIDAITEYYQRLSACGGRSNHHLANEVGTRVDEARETVRRFIGAAKKEEIIFTRNTTEGLNLVAASLGLLPGDTVVIGDKEHNSNLVPWLRLQQTVRISVKVIKSLPTNEIDMHAWEQALNSPVKLVSLGFTSNLDGTTNPIKDICRLAHRNGALMMVDAAQAVPHQPINVRELDVDFLAFSAHKMCGPSGMGVLYGKLSRLDQLQPFMVGGDTVARTSYDSYEMLPLPEKFEAGLQDYAGAMGTKAAIDYLISIGLDQIHHHEQQLNQALTQELAQFKRIHIIGPAEAVKRGGITSFTVDGADHHQVAMMLDQVGNIQVRSGQHCVHSWFADRGIAGSVRASFYFYNTPEEIAHFVATLHKILAII